MKLRNISLPVLFMLCMWTCNANSQTHTVTLTWVNPTAQSGVTVKSVNVYKTATCGTYGTTPLAKVTTGATFVDSSVSNGALLCYVVKTEASCDATVDCTGNTLLANGNFESVKSNEVTVNIPKLAVIINTPGTLGAAVN
jgi:hypothetical protein